MGDCFVFVQLAQQTTAIPINTWDFSPEDMSKVASQPANNSPRRPSGGRQPPGPMGGPKRQSILHNDLSRTPNSSNVQPCLCLLLKESLSIAISSLYISHSVPIRLPYPALNTVHRSNNRHI